MKNQNTQRTAGKAKTALPAKLLQLALGCTFVLASERLHPACAADAPWQSAHNLAVQQARNGDTATALPLLMNLYHAHPADLGLMRDTLVVASWADDNDDVVKLYEALPVGLQPDYVLLAAGGAYLRLQQYQQALNVYHEGAARFPGNPAFLAGEISSLTTGGDPGQALAMAEDDLHQHGDRLPILLAASNAAMALKHPVEALRYCDRALAIAPQNHDAMHDRIIAISSMGAPATARTLADQNPGIINPREQRYIEGDAAAQLVRWDGLEPASEAERYAANDRAIAELDALITKWSNEGDETGENIKRARFDRMVALRDRSRMNDVIAEYEDFTRNNVEIPPYALVAVGDAYLYVREPEKAHDVFARALKAEPNDFGAQMGMFYADNELEDFDAAFHDVDALDAAEGRWIYLNGLDKPLPNTERADADVAAANARLYAEELADSQQMFETLAFNAPNNTHFIAGVAKVYAVRGWPRQAMEELEIGRALKPKDVELEAAQGEDNLELRNYKLAETESADLTNRFPENLEVQRLAREVEVQNMAEFYFSADKAFRSSTNIQGGNGLELVSELYSPPIDYNWRLFTGDTYAQEQTEEGNMILHRGMAGVEYSDTNFLATAEATRNTYQAEDRYGGKATGEWFINDQWTLSGNAEYFTQDVPLRALRNGVSANEGGGALTYRVSESEKVTVSTEEMGFSDGNFRADVSGAYLDRLYTTPEYTIDGLVNIAGEKNSGNQNVLYFNPAQDALATVGVDITQILYRRYEFVYSHDLLVTPGAYWESGYGTGAAADIRYQQKLILNDTMELGAGIGYGIQPVDGKYEGSIDITFNLTLAVLIMMRFPHYPVCPHNGGAVYRGLRPGRTPRNSGRFATIMWKMITPISGSSA